MIGSLALVVFLAVTVVMAALQVRAGRGREARRCAVSPAGCCTCGTGGPYYDGPLEPVDRTVRYLYGDLCGGPMGETPDWSACSDHPQTGVTPVVDYGRDIFRTVAEVEADYAAALAARRAAR